MQATSTPPATPTSQPRPTPLHRTQKRRSGRPDLGGHLRNIMQTLFEEQTTGQDYTWMELDYLRPVDRTYGA